MTTNEQSNRELQRKAYAAEIKEINSLYEQFKAAETNVSDNLVTAANNGYKIGLMLQTWSGLERPTEDFFRKYCDGVLPFDFETAKVFVSIRTKMRTPAKSIQDVAHLSQQLLLAGDAIELPERTTTQTAVSVSPFQRFVSEIVLFRAPFSKLLRELPMERWDKARLKKLRTEWEWIIIADKQAAKLLEA